MHKALFKCSVTLGGKLQFDMSHCRSLSTKVFFPPNLKDGSEGGTRSTFELIRSIQDVRIPRFPLISEAGICAISIVTDCSCFPCRVG